MQQVAKTNIWKHQLPRTGCCGVEPRTQGRARANRPVSAQQQATLDRVNHRRDLLPPGLGKNIFISGVGMLSRRPFPFSFVFPVSFVMYLAIGDRRHDVWRPPRIGR